MISHRRQRRERKSSDPIKELNRHIKKELKIDMEVKKKLGGGSFGTVYKGSLNNETVAIKVEMSKESDCLEHEAKIYLQIHADPNQNYQGISRCLYFNSNDESYRILVLPLLGKNLQSLLRKYGKPVPLEGKPKKTIKTFSVKTVCLIAKQVLEHLKFLHSQGIVHKDIKPENLIIRSNHGVGRGVVQIMDFGLSRFYRNRDGTHIKFRTRSHVEGTPRFMGRNCALAHETSRRDDFQALAYTLIYFLRGRLLWQGLDLHGKPKMSTTEKREAILAVKEKTSAAELCAGLPNIFERFVKYSNKLEFDETPNYDHWINLFFNYVKEEYGDVDYKMDWM